jgi:hypothetical protein
MLSPPSLHQFLTPTIPASASAGPSYRKAQIFHTFRYQYNSSSLNQCQRHGCILTRRGGPRACVNTYGRGRNHRRYLGLGASCGMGSLDDGRGT